MAREKITTDNFLISHDGETYENEEAVSCCKLDEKAAAHIRPGVRDRGLEKLARLVLWLCLELTDLGSLHTNIHMRKLPSLTMLTRRSNSRRLLQASDLGTPWRSNRYSAVSGTGISEPDTTWIANLNNRFPNLLPSNHLPSHIAGSLRASALQLQLRVASTSNDDENLNGWFGSVVRPGPSFSSSLSGSNWVVCSYAVRTRYSRMNV